MSEANDFFATTELSARLDLVRHLIENSELVPLVRGPSGIGKTLLATRLRQLASENWSVCHFEADPSMQPERLLATIARCSGLPDIAGELLQRLVDRFEVLRKRGRIPVLLVDDAQMLPPTSLITLLRLFERQLDGVRLVSIVLFADLQIDLLLSTPQLQVMSPQAIQVIDLPVMTRLEASAYMSFLLKNEGLSEKLALDEVRLNRIYRETKGIPGPLATAILNAVGENGSDKFAGPYLTGYKKQLLIGGLPLLLVVLLFMWLISPLIEPGSETESIPDRWMAEKEIEPLPAPAALARPETPMPEMAETETVPPALPQSVVEPNLEMAPETPVDAIEEPVEIATLDAVIEAGVESEAPSPATPQALEQPQTKGGTGEFEAAQVKRDAAMETGTVGLHPTTPDQATDSVEARGDRQQQPEMARRQQVDGEDSQVITTERQTLEDAVEDKDRADTPVEIAAVDESKLIQEETGDAASTWVMSRSPGSYTLQLIAVENLDSLKRYVEKNDLVGETHTFRMKRNAKPWYALLWGEFPDRLSAQKAVSGLPARVQKAGVWPRTFASLQQSKAR